MFSTCSLKLFFFFIPKACLGADAKEGRNVVQITAESEDGEEVTHTLFSMRVGGTEMVGYLFTTVHGVTLILVITSIIGSCLSYCATSS